MVYIYIYIYRERGMFAGFLEDKDIKIHGVEAGGHSLLLLLIYHNKHCYY